MSQVSHGTFDRKSYGQSKKIKNGGHLLGPFWLSYGYYSGEDVEILVFLVCRHTTEVKEFGLISIKKHHE